MHFRALLLCAVLALVDTSGHAEEAGAGAGAGAGAAPVEDYKVNNLLKRQDLGSPTREVIVAALAEVAGNAGKAAVLLRKQCTATLEGCTPELAALEKEEAAAEAADAEAAATFKAERKGERKKISCDVCEFVATVIDGRIRKELPDQKTIETGFRLLPDGTRRVDTMLEVESELYFTQMLSGVCAGDNLCGSIPNFMRRGNCGKEPKRYEQSCEILVNEYEAELHATIREWPRVLAEDGTYGTPGFEEKMANLCSKEIKACKKVKKPKKAKGKKDDL